MRILTRPDFDGLVCAVLLRDIFGSGTTIDWVEPYEIKQKQISAGYGDIVANLPYISKCEYWFDHHQTNSGPRDFKGLFKKAPSAAGNIYEYFNGSFKKDYSELVFQADKIDSADLDRNEVLHPAVNPWFLISLTMSLEKDSYTYFHRLAELTETPDAADIISDYAVKKRILQVNDQRKKYEKLLEKYSSVWGNITVTDFRPGQISPGGNRFLIFALYPDLYSNLKIRYAPDNSDKVIVSIGHSIFNRSCRVSAGRLAARYGGGGHPGAGSFSLPENAADKAIAEIAEILNANQGGSV